VQIKARIEAERAGTPFVVYFDDEHRQRLVSLDAPRLAIGRADDAAICVSWDTQVSRIHAELERVGDHWIVADEGLSRNGTYLNEARIAGRRPLADRDVLRVGLTSLLFREPSPRAEVSTVLGEGAEMAASITAAQRRVLVALCRPFAGGSAYATPATNPQIAEELFLSVAAVKTHLRRLFHAFDIEALPQQEKRHRLVAMAFASGVVTDRDLT
jgi:pSer/pThr/pTyr-binding forkhead associated (FHA) protein